MDKELKKLIDEFYKESLKAEIKKLKRKGVK